jgi:hypothetical protein
MKPAAVGGAGDARKYRCSDDIVKTGVGGQGPEAGDRKLVEAMIHLLN